MYHGFRRHPKGNLESLRPNVHEQIGIATSLQTLKACLTYALRSTFTSYIHKQLPQVTYKNLERWYEELQQHCRDIPCFLVANKIDVNYAVTEKKFGFAEKHNLPFTFVSASDGCNVVKVFKTAISAALRYKESPKDDVYAAILDLLDQDKQWQLPSKQANGALANGKDEREHY